MEEGEGEGEWERELRWGRGIGVMVVGGIAVGKEKGKNFATWDWARMQRDSEYPHNFFLNEKWGIFF